MAKKKTKLPPYVSKDKSRYVYKPYLGRENSKVKWGKPVRLCGLEAPLSEVWREYERIQGRSTDTLKWLLTKYNASDKFQSLAVATQVGYEGYLEVICNRKTGDGTFGDTPLKSINVRTIRRYLDSYRAKTTGNRHIQYIKAAWNWGAQRYDAVPETNPCIGVELNSEKPRDRYVTKEEFALVYEIALSMRVPYFAHAMQLAYLCRARRSEVFAFTHADIMEEGLFLKRGKGSENEITLWTPRLRDAVQGCKSIYPKAPRPLRDSDHFLLHNKNGKPFPKNALDSAWQRIIAKAKAHGLKASFTFHDIKAAGCTDHENENAGMHKSKKMIAVYDRLPKQIPATR